VQDGERVASTIMNFKLLLLLIGLCAISCHQATAEAKQGTSFTPNV